MPDATGDGLDDVLVGAPDLYRSRGPRVGATYLVEGGPARTVELAFVGSDGVKYKGGPGGNAGTSSAFVGDFDRNGVDDLLIGSPDAISPERLYPGVSYIAELTQPPIHDPPPTARYISYNETQQPERGSYCWDGFCVDRAPTWPKAHASGNGEKANIFLNIRQRPKGFTVQAHKRLDEFDRPTGRGRALDVRLDPFGNEDNPLGWWATFDLPNWKGDAYLTASGAWAGDDRGDSSWFLHLKLTDEAYVGPPDYPTARLLSGRTSVRGIYGAYCWFVASSRGPGMNVCTGEGPPPESPEGQDEPVEPDWQNARSGGRVSIRIHTKFKPERTKLVFRTRSTDSGWPAGRRTEIPHRLAKHRTEAGTVRWDVRFRLPQRQGETFIILRAGWLQRAYWHFPLLLH
jgi:hypothetical protein